MSTASPPVAPVPLGRVSTTSPPGPLGTVSTFDRLQWQALVRAALKTDLRATGRSLDFGGQARGGLAFAASLVVFVIMGAGVALFVAVSPDPRLAATIYLGVLAFVIASSLLIEYQAVVLSPADYRQLAFQPVSSRTFLAARLTSVLVYVLAMTVAFSIGPFVAFAFGRHGGLLVVMAASVAAALEALTVTSLVIGLYVAVLELIPAVRLTRALSYLQLAFSFVVYGSYMAVPALLGSDVLVEGAVLPVSWWLLLNPVSWFAGWIAMAGAGGARVDAVAAGLSLVAVVLSGWVVAGRLSIGYAERLGEMGEAASWHDRAHRARPLGRGRIFANGEARAVALLVRAQFRYDQRFRLTVLSIVPLTLVYLVSGLREGHIDPFAPDGGETLVYLAVMLFPPMVRSALGQSEAYRAAWIFHGTPASKPGLVLAVKQFIVAFFLLPYLVILGGLYVWLVGKPWAMLLHMTVLALVSHLVLLIDLLLNPEIPFSQPISRGTRSFTTFVSIVGVTVIGVLLHVGQRFAYATVPGTLAMLIGLGALNLVGEAALRERLRSLDVRAEFDG